MGIIERWSLLDCDTFSVFPRFVKEHATGAVTLDWD